MYGIEMNYAVLVTCINRPEIKPDKLFRNLKLIDQRNSNVVKTITKNQREEINYIMIDLGISFDTVQYDLGLDTNTIETLTKKDANRVIKFYKPYCLM
jgi:hypothetical protein